MELTEKKVKQIYKENFTEYLLCLALDVGEGMLKNGGEVSRVEDTIERICRAYGAVHVEVFTIISVINAAVRMPDGTYSSQLRRIKSTSTNLGALEKFNALSREICATRPALSVFDEKIAEVKKARFYAPVFQYLASAAAAGGFAMFFGGSIKDGILAFLLGAIVAFVDIKAPKQINGMAKTVFSALVTSLFAILGNYMGIADSADYVIIGVIMLLVPGVAFGTAMRDLLYGDLIAGTLKLLQAVLTALMIAFGYMISFSFLSAFNVQVLASVSQVDFEVFFKWELLIAAITSFTGSVAFAVIFRVMPRHLLAGGICGLITYVLYYVVEFYTSGMVFVAAFASTMFTALFAEIASRRFRAPTIVFLIPGVIPTVPGGSLYRTMRYILTGDGAQATSALIGTLETALGIAGGIVFVSIIYNIVSTKMREKKLLREKKS